MRIQTGEGVNMHDQELFKTFKDRQYPGHKKCPTALAWSPDGSYLVTAQNSIRIWLFSQISLDRAGEVNKAHDNNVDWVQFGTNNLFGTLSKQSLKFWDVRESGKVNLLRNEKKNKQDFIRFSWNASLNEQSLEIAVINKDSTVFIYDYRKMNSPKITLTPPKSSSNLEYCAASWDKTNSVLFLAGGQSNNGSLSLFSAQTYEPLAEPIITHGGKITDISFANNNKHFATAADDSLVQLHSIPDIICQRVYSNKFDSNYRRVSFSCQDSFIAASSETNYIQILNAKKGGLSYKIKSSSGQEVLGWHPNKMVLAYLDEDDRRRSMDRGEDSFLHLFYK